VRIKRLELSGFKSSKDRTVLEFPDGITGIVGPNGCGKSNIVDALRWVLGEQSARQLRGRSMEDVIFIGNQHYGPLGMAEVTIVLDNENGLEAVHPDHSEQVEEESEVVRALRKVPELQVTRRLYRSGESEYLINERPCRLRDITELFLGTGVGTKAYSIVEQGRVGQIIGAKPDELRLFIEEAAGTTLYRSRKVAAERKIERTRDNLLRVSDIVRELERQANSLRRQARGAVQYQELRSQEDLLDRAWTTVRLQGVDELLREATEAAAEQSGREHALRLEIARGHEERDAPRARPCSRHGERCPRRSRKGGIWPSGARSSKASWASPVTISRGWKNDSRCCLARLRRRAAAATSSRLAMKKPARNVPRSPRASASATSATSPGRRTPI
jgi:chromosome segregation protein